MFRVSFLACYLLAFGGWTIAVAQENGIPCSPRTYGYDSFVCVCNATYCDTIPRPTIPPEGEFLVYSSDATSKRFSMSQGSFTPLQDEVCVEKANAMANFTLDPATMYQIVVGYGGAFTDAAAFNILSLSPEAQEMLLSSYFAVDGLEYNIGRINMGGCDFSWRVYTCADDEDVTLDSFALQPEDLDYKIPVIRRAEAIAAQPLKLFASPWTAPPWMKTNNDYIGYGQLLPEMYQPWANYFVKFLDGYAANGVNMWGLTAQNEPIDGYVPGFFFNCMGWTAEEQRKWVAENLGPTLQANGYGDVILMIMDDQRYELPKWAETVLNDTAAAQYVDGIAVHWYGDAYTDSARLDDTHFLFPSYFILGTEACEGAMPLETAVELGSWKRLESYAHDIIVDMNHWVTGWTDWNLALDMIGGPNWSENFVDAPIIVNQQADEFYKNPMFYAMGHFSKFVREGAVRIDLSSDSSEGLETTAFRNPDGTFALIILNRSDMEVEARIVVPGRGTMVVTVGSRSLHTAVFA